MLFLAEFAQEQIRLRTDLVLPVVEQGKKLVLRKRLSDIVVSAVSSPLLPNPLLRSMGIVSRKYNSIRLFRGGNRVETLLLDSGSNLRVTRILLRCTHILIDSSMKSIDIFLSWLLKEPDGRSTFFCNLIISFILVGLEQLAKKLKHKRFRMIIQRVLKFFRFLSYLLMLFSCMTMFSEDFMTYWDKIDFFIYKKVAKIPLQIENERFLKRAVSRLFDSLDSKLFLNTTTLTSSNYDYICYSQLFDAILNSRYYQVLIRKYHGDIKGGLLNGILFRQAFITEFDNHFSYHDFEMNRKKYVFRLFKDYLCQTNNL